MPQGTNILFWQLLRETYGNWWHMTIYIFNRKSCCSNKFKSILQWYGVTSIEETKCFVCLILAFATCDMLYTFSRYCPLVYDSSSLKRINTIAGTWTILPIRKSIRVADKKPRNIRQHIRGFWYRVGDFLPAPGKIGPLSGLVSLDEGEYVLEYDMHQLKKFPLL